MIEAKTVSDKFWVICENNKKIGTINAEQKGYSIKVDEKTAYFDTLQSLKEKTNIKFVDVNATKCSPVAVHDYPAHGEVHNSVWDMNDQLPLYTKAGDSKCWYAAGYYNINLNGKWDIVYCPKLIILRRNEYHGPFKRDPYS
ncbi:MAG: hypothetical protein HOK52_12950 [Candidatus Marinimicrobia bacterium]|jgi:hypothetical protein|nr:hypothetical protein [Candidatus Neomarinimicrobiota bacterium]